MYEKGNLVTTMTGLLMLMGRGSRKAGAVLTWHRSTPPELYIEEHFDDAKSHTRVFANRRSYIGVPGLFRQALRKKYITNRPRQDPLSDWQFVITNEGQAAYMNRFEYVVHSLKELPLGKGIRAGEIVVLACIPDEVVVVDVLSYLVCEGHVETYEQKCQKFYLRTEKRN